MTDTQKPETNLQIAGYTYKAENYCLHHALANLERNLNHPLFDVHALSAVTDDDEMILAIAAEHLMEIDHHNPYSYDSDVFPKPFTKEQAEPDEFCPDCGHRFSDGAQVMPYTITGLELKNGQTIFSHIMVGHIGAAVDACFDKEEDGIGRWVAQVIAATPEEAIRRAQELEFTDGPE